jgi:hypothetical protein
VAPGFEAVPAASQPLAEAKLGPRQLKRIRYLAVDLKCLCELLTKAVFGRQQTLTTVGGGQDQSQFDLSDQTVDGVSGDIECSDLAGIPAESSMRDGINFNASFDARS